MLYYRHISNLDNFAELLKTGVEGVASVAQDMPIMMHLTPGGQYKEAVFWLDNMIVHGVYLTLSVNLTIPGGTGPSMI